jgi:hypothetical protein
MFDLISAQQIFKEMVHEGFIPIICLASELPGVIINIFHLFYHVLYELENHLWKNRLERLDEACRIPNGL